MAFQSRRRGRLAISVAILKAAKKGTKITHLMTSVHLSYEQATRYVQFLRARGFVRYKHDALYQTTEKGFQLIEEFDSSSLIRKVVAT